MIAVFPSIYPDELLYSQLARFYARSGYPGYVFAAEDLFQNKTVRPDIEFLNAYTPEALRLITHEKPIEEIVLEHTMFPYYARFIGHERRMKAFQSLVAMDAAYHNLLPLPKSKEKTIRRLRYCPICAENDRQIYGETYWHRVHQMHGIRICPIHHCSLIDTNIRMDSRVSPTLVTAEEVVANHNPITMSDDPIECGLAEYVAEVFQAEFDIESTVEVGQYLHSRMEGTKYLSRRGQQRNIALTFQPMTNALHSRHKSMPTTSFVQAINLFIAIFAANSQNVVLPTSEFDCVATVHRAITMRMR